MCTRALWRDNGQAVLVGRNMDWFDDLGTNLWALPRGRRRRGLENGNALEWTVQHGSLVATEHDRATTDGTWARSRTGSQQPSRSPSRCRCSGAPADSGDARAGQVDDVARLEQAHEALQGGPPALGTEPW